MRNPLARIGLAASATLWLAAAAIGQPDDHSDDCAHATPLLGPQPRLTGTVAGVADTDWFRLSLLPGFVYDLHDYWFDCTVCPRVRVFQTDCVSPILEINHATTTYEDPFWFIAPESGDVLVAVDTPPGQSLPNGPYEIRFDRLSGPVVDDFPDSPALAAAVPTDGTWTAGRIDFAVDRDVFRFTGRAGHVYLIVNDPSCDAVVVAPLEELTTISDRLEGGVRAVINDPSDFSCVQRPETCAGRRILIPPGPDRVIYITVSFQYAGSAAPNPYRLRVVDDGPITTIPTSTDCTRPLPLPGIGEPFTVQMPPVGSALHFRFDPQPGHVYRFDALASIGPFEPRYLVLFDCQNQEFDGFVHDLTIAPHYQCLTGGSRLFTILPAGVPFPTDPPTPPAIATFRVTDLGAIADDHTPAQPRRVIPASGEPVVGHTDFPTDRDAFVIDAVGGRVYDVSLTGPGWSGWYEYAGSGGGSFDQRWAPEAAFSLYVPANESGPLTIDIEGFRVGEYALLATSRVPAGLRGQSCDMPIPIVADETLRRIVVDSTDGDEWLAFDGVADHTYRIDADQVLGWAGHSLAVSPSCGDVSTALEARFHQYIPSADGPVYVRPSDFGIVDLLVADLTLQSDREPGTPAGAIPMSARGAPAAGAIGSRADVDCFRVVLRPREYYTWGVRILEPGAARVSVCGVSAGNPCAREPVLDDFNNRAWREHGFLSPDAGENPSGEYIVRVEGVAEGGTPGYQIRIYRALCRADWNDDDAADAADIYAFLDDYLGRHPDADFDASGAVDVQDLLDFVTAWFRGCS